MTRRVDAPTHVTVRRWRRYGFDRLYGDTSDSRCVGWLDLDTGEVRIEIPALGAAFERAVAERQRARSGDAPHLRPFGRERSRSHRSE